MRTINLFINCSFKIPQLVTVQHLLTKSGRKHRNGKTLGLIVHTVSIMIFFTPERSDENQSQNVVDDMEVDPTYQVEESPQKKMKYQYMEESTLKNSDIDDMPYRFRHIRNGLRSVRPEIYTLMVKLKSKYHMSQQQAEAAITETANSLFNREWKYFDPEKPTDCNTVPAGSNTRRIEP